MSSLPTQESNVFFLKFFKDKKNLRNLWKTEFKGKYGIKGVSSDVASMGKSFEKFETVRDSPVAYFPSVYLEALGELHTDLRMYIHDFGIHYKFDWSKKFNRETKRFEGDEKTKKTDKELAALDALAVLYNVDDEIEDKRKRHIKDTMLFPPTKDVWRAYCEKESIKTSTELEEAIDNFHQTKKENVRAYAALVTLLGKYMKNLPTIQKNDKNDHVCRDLQILRHKAYQNIIMYLKIVSPVLALHAETRTLYDTLHQAMNGTGDYDIGSLYMENYRCWGSAFNFAPKGWENAKQTRRRTQIGVDSYVESGSSWKVVLRAMMHSVNATIETARQDGVLDQAMFNDWQKAFNTSLSQQSKTKSVDLRSRKRGGFSSRHQKMAHMGAEVWT